VASAKNSEPGEQRILPTYITKEDWSQLSVKELKEVIEMLELQGDNLTTKDSLVEMLSKFAFKSKQAQKIIKYSEPVAEEIGEDKDTWTCQRLTNLIEKLGFSCSEQTVYLALLYHKPKTKEIGRILEYNEVRLSKHGAVQVPVLQSVHRESSQDKNLRPEIAGRIS
jgi:hypothetical protein